MIHSIRRSAWRVSAAIFAFASALGCAPSNAPRPDAPHKGSLLATEAGDDRPSFATVEAYIADLDAHAVVMRQRLHDHAIAAENTLTQPPEGHPTRQELSAFIVKARKDMAAYDDAMHVLLQDVTDFTTHERDAISHCPPDLQAYLRERSIPMFDRADRVVARMDRAVDSFVKASNDNFDFGERMLQVKPSEANIKAYKGSLELARIKQNLEASQAELRAASTELTNFKVDF